MGSLTSLNAIPLSRLAFWQRVLLRNWVVQNHQAESKSTSPKNMATQEILGTGPIQAESNRIAESFDFTANQLINKESVDIGASVALSYSKKTYSQH